MPLKRLLQPAVLVQCCIALVLLFSFVARAGKGIEATWVMSILAAGAALFCLWTPARNIRVPSSAFWFGAFFLCWSVLSFLFSSTQTYGLDEMMKDTAGFLLFLCAVRLAPDALLREKFYTVLTILVLLACVVGVAVYVLQPVSRFSGVFFHMWDARDYWPNAWAEFVLLAWPIALFRMRTVHRAVRLSALGLIFAALVLSFSRGAVLVLGVQLLLAGIFWLHHTSKNGMRRQQVTACVADALAIAVVTGALFVGLNAARGAFFPVESLVAKATLTASEGMQTVDERKQFWVQSVVLAQEKPVFGWGPGSFRFVQPRLQQHVLATSDHPHNVFLKLSMERGWMAAVLFFLFLVVSLFRFPLSLIGDPKRAFVTVSLIGVIAHNIIDYNLQFTLIAVPFWLLLGIAASDASTKTWFAKAAALLRWKKKAPTVPYLQNSIQVLLAVALLLLVVIEGRFLVLERLSKGALAAGNEQSAIELMKKAQHMLFPRDVHLELASLLLDQQRIEEANTVLQDLRSKNAEDARLWILLGDVSLMINRPDDAHAAYSQAFRLSGWNDLRPLHGVAQSLLRSKSAQEKNTFFPVADARLDQFATAIRANTHFIALSWHVEEFARSSEELAKVYPLDRTPILRRKNEVELLGSRARAARARERQGYLW